MMSERERIEKVRQEIMRFRELLNIMRLRLEDGERNYNSLFANLPPADIQTLKTKDLQWKLAETLVDDLSSLSRAVVHTRYDARQLERDFEELYNIITSEPPED
jgi:hypothetical protein